MLRDLRSTLNSAVGGEGTQQLTLQGHERLSAGRGVTENSIIHGDNALALEVLRTGYEGKVRCVYIDPPYNNSERYTHYSDNQAHNDWLRGVVSCVRQLKALLRDDGSLWVSIDDHQVHYLKVALDDVFGRDCFISTVVWEQRTTRENRKVFSNNHEYVLVYAKNPRRFKATRGSLEWNSTVLSRFKNPDHDPRGPWQSVSANVQAGHATPSQFYELVAPSGRRHNPPKGRCWALTRDRMNEEIAQGRVWFGANGQGAPRFKRFLSEAKRGFTPHTLWPASEVGTNDSAKKHLLELFPDHSVFDTPKPEGLIQRILRIGSEPGDLVLDAYLGSGTTAAVAHKMGRRYIGIESGDHAATLCVDRIRKVIAGEQGGISKSVGWKGGGAFNYFKLECQNERASLRSSRASVRGLRTRVRRASRRSDRAAKSADPVSAAPQ